MLKQSPQSPHSFLIAYALTVLKFPGAVTRLYELCFHGLTQGH